IGEAFEATLGPALQALDLLLVGAPQLVPCRPHALFAAVAAPVLAAEALFLRNRCEDLAPLSVLEDDLIAAGKDLKRLADLLHLIEAHRTSLVKNLEIGRIDEVRHRNSVDFEAEPLDRIGAFVGIHDLG